MTLAIDKDRYTFADYLTWDEQERMELYEGIPVALASPSEKHQSILFEFGRQLGNYLEGKSCRAYHAPFDVRLFEREADRPEDVTTVVQPDLMVVCDPFRIDRHGIHGAPDFVLEVLSPSTVRQDRLVKLNLYQQAGVREYWIISPEEETAQVFLLEKETLHPHEIYSKKDVAKINILEGCFIEMQKIFRN